MAKSLKVYQAQFGFYDSVVAAANQKAALRAWGTHQNLFAEGQAHVATDEAAIAAALSQPDVPLKRAVGSTDPFGLKPGLPQIPDLPPSREKKAARRQAAPATAAAQVVRASPKPAPKPQPPPPDRRRLDAAEAAMRTLEDERHRQTQAFEQRRTELARDVAEAQSRWDARKRAAQKDFDAADGAYRKAGGTD
ncbi:hypothetical protein LGH83_02280 [Lichenihabitans sp. PAMC28606]|uniref:hypothetical protein n=1 Tax=Lichenihabitans sp. PAMC28606 TaxID=2880932 RepID=UPI001D0AF8A3|nr:hypothetical protein [Lichenihabitans sp. PAMC28606]UDL95101.1 hypothetical protein LGH83_02280 [Lichenihabitans sp. PAMC28606]